jgi:hypothetical protein
MCGIPFFLSRAPRVQEIAVRERLPDWVFRLLLRAPTMVIGWAEVWLRWLEGGGEEGKRSRSGKKL